MPSRFDVLGIDSSDESDEGEEEGIQQKEAMAMPSVPSYEDLSLTRIDEETVLSAVYGNDFSRKEGPWGSRIFCVHVRPIDIAPEQIGSQLM